MRRPASPLRAAQVIAAAVAISVPLVPASGAHAGSSAPEATAQIGVDPVDLDFDGDGLADVFWYHPGAGGDVVWTSTGEGFASRSVQVFGAYEPVLGDYDGSGSTDILWYASGRAADSLWRLDGAAPASTALSVTGTYLPLVGDFDGVGGDDIFWYAPGSTPDYVWRWTGEAFGSTALSVSGAYRPLVGDLDGTGGDDIFWYAPGSTPDYLWRWTGDGFGTTAHAVSGSYRPIVGDLTGTGSDDIFWYGPGSTPDHLWRWNGSRFASSSHGVNGRYQPVVGAFGGGADRILWYGPGGGGDSIWQWNGSGFDADAVSVRGHYRPLTSTTGPVPAPYASSRAAVGAGTDHPLTHSWRPGCPVGPSSLLALRFRHWHMDGGQTEGTLIVHRDVADDVDSVLRHAHAVRFPIRKAVPIDHYGGDDDRSMADDNTSAFNCRTVAGTSTWSEHAYGLAVDVNPVENPYVAGGTVEPPAGAAYTDRADVRPGMVVDGDVVVGAFGARGWGWGGHWSRVKDYQHFSTTGR